MIASFQIHYGDLQRKNNKYCVIIQIFLDFIYKNFFLQY